MKLLERLQKLLDVPTNAQLAEHIRAFEAFKSDTEAAVVEILELTEQVAQTAHQVSVLLRDVDGRLSYYEKHSGAISMLHKKLRDLREKAAAARESLKNGVQLNVAQEDTRLADDHAGGDTSQSGLPEGS